MSNSPWLTVTEVCEVAKCGAKLVYREIKAGRLRAAHIGGRRDIRVHRDWIDEYLNRCATPIEVSK
jgi:excisionase family DNA binding protein